MNVDIDITKTTLLKVGVSGSLRKQNDTGSGTDNLWTVLMGYNSIMMPAEYSDGKIPGWADKDDNMNPWVMTTQSGYNESWKNNIQTSLTLEQKLDFVTKGLRFVGRFGYDTYNSNWIKRYKSPAAYKADRYRQPDGTLNFTKIRDEKVMSQSSNSEGEKREFFEWELHYSRAFKTHHVGGVLKYTQASKIFTQNIGTDLKNGIPYRNQGIAGRFNYNWNYRYFIDFNFGYNGSENFAPEKRFGFFPSGSIGYVISEEAFMKKQKVVDYLKLRASIGLVGNDNISDNRFLYLSNSWLVDQLPSEKDYWNAYKNGYNFGFNNGNMIKGAIESRIGNPNVSWETALKQNYGIDVNFLNNRLKVSADIFFEDRKDILIKRQTIPITTNLTSDNLPVVNMGRVKNHGYEIDLKWEDVIKGKLHYYINANVSYNRNKIIFQDEVEPNEPYQWRTGQPVGTIFGYVADGFYNDSDFENGKLKEGLPKPTMDVSPGDVKYTDLNGDGLITDDDQRAIGNPTRPAYTWGLNYGADYKGFFFSMNWTAATERSLVLDYFFRKPFGNNANNALMQFHADNRWTPATAETATVPRFATKSMDYNSYTSSLWVKNGNFLKLKTLTIGYNFKERKALKKLGISQLGIKFSGYNLLTFDSFKIMDPECTPGLTDSYPIIKIYNIGINLTF